MSSTPNIYKENSIETVLEIPFISASWDSSSSKMNDNIRKNNDNKIQQDHYHDGIFIYSFKI